MRVALLSRTVVLVAWLLGVLWHGLREPAGIAVAVALAAVWVAALLRDHAETPGPPALDSRPAEAT